MDTNDFQKAKEEVMDLARRSVLFGLLLPQKLIIFEEMVTGVKQSPNSEEFLSFFIELFKEEREKMAPTLDLIRDVIADATK